MRKLFILSALLLTLCVSNASAEERKFEIHAKKFSFTPSILKVNKGDNVSIRLLSEDVHHGFYLDGYELEMSARPGQSESLNFIADKTGKFNFRCSVTCGEFHPYMIGYIIIEPNTSFNGFVLLIIGIGVFSLLFQFFRKKRENING